MTDKNYDVIVDREYGQIPRKGSPRQIKTRSTSFDKIKGYFNSIRLERLKKKLDQKVEQALTQGYKMDNYEKKLNKSANVIARLEEKIMILSGEDVPTNYVSRRAIKLRESMASNLTYNSGLMYTVGLENRDAVLGSGIAEEEKEEVPVVETPAETETTESADDSKGFEMPAGSVLAAAAPSGETPDKIDVVPSDLERKEIENIINSNFDEVRANEAGTEEVATEEKVDGSTETPQVDGEMPAVDKEEVRDAVNEAFDAMKNESPAAEAMPPLGRTEVQTAVEEVFKAMKAEREVQESKPELGKADIQATVEEVFKAMKAEREAQESKPELGKADIQATVEEVFKAMKAEREAQESKPTLGQEEIRAAVEEAFKSLREERIARENATPLGVEDVQTAIPVVEEEPVVEAAVVDKATDAAIDAEVDKAIERIRVSRNNSSVVNASQYDENGYRRERRKKYNYIPMTDEEIRQSQIKLGFDEHGNIIDSGVKKPREEVVSSAKIIGNFVAPGSIPSVSIADAFIPAAPTPEKQMREIPVVVPERDEASFDLDDDKSLFEIIEQPAEEEKEEVYHVAETATVEETPSQESDELSIDDYAALKKKILFLQEQRKVTHQQKVDAQKAAEESAADANAARRLYEISQANYNERIKKLIKYTERLEADCDENVRSAAQAEDDARKNSDFAQAQREMVDKNNRIIGEIDSMIESDESQDSTGKVR